MIAVARRAVPGELAELAELMASLPRRGTLTAADEAAYFARIRAGGEDGRAARDEFAALNVPLVISLAKAHRRRGSSLEDAVQAGNLGLLRAIEDFDPARGVKFSTYATRWIRQAIRRHGELDRLIHVPVNYFFERGAAAIQSEDCRESAALALAASTVRSGPDGEGAIFDVAAVPNREPDPADAAAVREEAARLRAWMGRLHPRHRQVLALRFGLDGEPPRTLEEVGEALGVTRQRAQQIEAKALEKLKAIASRVPRPALPPTVAIPQPGEEVPVSAHRLNGLFEPTTFYPDAPGEDVGPADPGPAVPPPAIAPADEPDAALVRRYAAAHPDLTGGELSRLIAVETGRKIHHFTILALLGRRSGGRTGRAAAALPGPAPIAVTAPAPSPAVSPVRRELAAMGAIADALEGLRPDEAARVLAWAAGRFGAEG